MERRTLEEAVAVDAELAERLRADPLFSWVPSPRQVPFVQSVLRDKVSEAWLIAANRSGKSDSAAYIGAVLARFGWDNPVYGAGESFKPTKGWVISATSNASRTVIQPKYFDNGMGLVESHAPFIPPREIASWNINEQTLKLRNGSIIEFKSAEAKTISFAGAGVDWVHIDEEIEKPKYDELVIRVGGGRRLVVFGACTLLPPEGQAGGVSWMFDEKIKPWLAAGGTESRQPEVWDKSYRLFGASVYDNPFLLPDEVSRLEGLYPVGSIERQIRLEGMWLPGLQGSRAYTSFDARVHMRPQADFIIRRPICWTWDFNVEPMISLIGQRDGNIFRIHKELVLDTDASIDEMVQYFHHVVPQHHGEVWIYGDASGRKRNTLGPGGRSEYQVLLNLMRTYGSPVRLKVPEANPLVTNRLAAVNRVLRNEQGVSHIEIDPSCKELMADLEQVLRDHKGGIKKLSDRKNPYARRTHASDALGYWISYEEPVRSATIGQRIAHAIRNPAYAFTRSA